MYYVSTLDMDASGRATKLAVYDSAGMPRELVGFAISRAPGIVTFENVEYYTYTPEYKWNSREYGGGKPMSRLIKVNT